LRPGSVVRAYFHSILLASVLVACAPVETAPWSVSETDWQAARARLGELRATLPTRPYGVVVRVSLREPSSGRLFEARGALAVDPARALRMILIGPGGGTAVDAWVTSDAYRFEVPPIGLLRRGGVSAEAGLPVGFFREWFLLPLAGRLLATSKEGDSIDDVSCAGRWFILRHGEGTTTLCDRDGEASPAKDRERRLDLFAVRRTTSSVEELSFRGHSLTPSPGDRAEYDDRRSRVRATVEVESLDESPPEPVAFLDPDHGGAR
jgi:hypothetical protein